MLAAAAAASIGAAPACTPVTLSDELWVVANLPFLMFGAANAALYAPIPAPNQSRLHYFRRVGAAAWLVHIALVKARTITLAESRAVMAELETYIVESGVVG